MNVRYTPEVKRLADRIRKLSIGEMLALREALAQDIDLPPDIGVREPRNPNEPTLSGEATAAVDD